MNEVEFNGIFRLGEINEHTKTKYQWASVESVREVYLSSLAKLNSEYRKLKEMLAII